MQSYFKTALLVFLALSINSGVRGQSNKEPQLDEPVVTLAVVPTYPLTALHSQTSGEVVIEVKIDSEGSVISADAVSGFPILVGGPIYCSSMEVRTIKDRKVRTVRLTFVYHLAPTGAPIEEMSLQAALSRRD
jgi:hypothetical protein